jgi:2-polyprenyl-6-methoxyphenol hydroxylase-like FAD-dependent oxidoreductase
MVHRAHLHEHLKKTALSLEGTGPPAQLHKATRIERADADNATIFLADGTLIRGDVLVAADGVHSIGRVEVSPSIQPFKTKHSAFRFLVTREAALRDPTTKALASTLGSMDMWYAEDRKIVMYPCADNTLLNFVCVHPAELSDAAATAGYDTNASKEKLLEVFQAFEPAVQAFLQMAEPDTIKVWPLFDMTQLPTFVRGCMALIGDAAHPFLPHLGQGGAQAVEDGVALGTMLSRGVDKAEVPARIQLYNEARYERASNIQQWTRLAGMDGASDDQESIANFAGIALFPVPRSFQVDLTCDSCRSHGKGDEP